MNSQFLAHFLDKQDQYLICPCLKCEKQENSITIILKNLLIINNLQDTS